MSAEPQDPGRADLPSGAPAADSGADPRADAGTAPTAFPSRGLLLGLVVGIVVLDQVSKAMVHAWLPLHSSVTIIPGLLDFSYVRNTGVAFGMLNDVDLPFKQALMTAIGLVALIAIGLYARSVPPGQPLARFGLAVIIGGASGNLIDRIASGYVVDFVDVYWGSWHFWAFNVADAGITVGACCLILDMVFGNPHVSETA